MKAKDKVKSDKGSGSPPCARLDDIEGNWHAYLRALNAIDANKNLPAGEALSARQKCALAYLGQRAQFNGGVFSKSTPRILSAQFVSTLATQNDAQRFKRYPWLERLIKLVAEIESKQQELTQDTKVLSFTRNQQ